MARGQNQKLKLYRLREIMLEMTDETHGLTMNQIQTELERYGITSERKSIYSDFEELMSTGVEVIGEKCGRDFLYHVVKRPFELAETKLLIDSIQASKFITKKKSTALINKIKGFASRYEAAQLERQVYVQGRIKTMNESVYYSVDAIHEAISNNMKICFRYCAWDTNKKLVPKRDGEFYVVSPWALILDDENYYLVAFDSDAGMVKHYRVDKMLRIDTIEEKREGKEHFKNFDLESYSVQNFGMFGGELKRVKIEFPDEMVGVFIDRFGKDIAIRPAKKGYSQVAVEVAVSRQFFGWIFGLGSNVKIVSPKSVVDKLGEAANEFADIYRPKR